VEAGQEDGPAIGPGEWPETTRSGPETEVDMPHKLSGDGNFEVLNIKAPPPPRPPRSSRTAEELRLVIGKTGASMLVLDHYRDNVFGTYGQQRLATFGVTREFVTDLIAMLEDARDRLPS
jgi:hypothetical protein